MDNHPCLRVTFEQMERQRVLIENASLVGGVSRCYGERFGCDSQI